MKGKIISMTKPKPKLKNLNPGLNTSFFHKKTLHFMKPEAKHKNDRDTYEWICGGLFLHYRAGESKTEVIELRGFS